MRRGWLLTALSLGAGISYSAFEWTPSALGQAGMVGAGTARAMVWGLFGNPAATAGIRDRTVSLLYSPEPFGLRELERSAVVVAEPAPPGCFSLAASRFGFDLYREVTIRISYAHQLGDQLDAGIAVSYYRLSVGSYGAAATAGVDIGLQWTIVPGLRGGFQATNLNAPSIGKALEKLPQTFAGGIAYEPFAGCSVVLDLVKDLRFPLESRLGIEYSPVDEFALRGGVSRDPTLFSAGFGLALHPVIIEYAFDCHPELGIVHHIGMTVKLSGW